MRLPVVGLFYRLSGWCSGVTWMADADLCGKIGVDNDYIQKVLATTAGDFYRRDRDSEVVFSEIEAVDDLLQLKELLSGTPVRMLDSSWVSYRRVDPFGDIGAVDITFLFFSAIASGVLTSWDVSNAQEFEQGERGVMFGTQVVTVPLDIHTLLTGQALIPYLATILPTPYGGFRSFVVYMDRYTHAIRAIVPTFFDRGIVPTSVVSFLQRLDALTL